MEITNTKYRATDGLADYVFTFEQRGDGWRVWIIDTPDYGGRATSIHATHRLFDNGRPYICWDRSLATLDAAKGVAALWADATQEYIRSGSFAAANNRAHVYDRSSSAHLSRTPEDGGARPQPPPRDRAGWFTRFYRGLVG